MYGSAVEEKSSFKKLELSSSFKLDWGSYIFSIIKTGSKEIGAFICSMNFLSPEVALYLCKSTCLHGILLPCLELCSQPLLGYVG